MAGAWIDNDTVKSTLSRFFSANKQEMTEFGSTVNQTFEAFVFASVINHYRQKGWQVQLKHPSRSSGRVKLKFSTRGRPDNYTYAVCTKGNKRIQVRHALRVATRCYKPGQTHLANIVVDVAVILDHSLARFKSDDQVPNSKLITFGEAKHMSAFAELVAGFIGMVHELIPDVLASKRHHGKISNRRLHPAPFLYVSGYLLRTAQGLVETITDRGYDIDIYDQESGCFFGLSLSRPPSKAP